MVSKEEKTPKADQGGSGLQQVQELYDLMVREKLDFIELKEENTLIRLARRSATGRGVSVPIPVFQPGPPVTIAPPTTALPSPATSSHKAIVAPLAGVFYRASAPTSAPFVKEGDIVEDGQTLCIVEAMKVMNEIKSEFRAKILRIPAENARPVTAGQALFEVEPA